DELLPQSGQLAGRRTAAGHPMDRAAGADAGVVPRLHGRVLGPGAGLARRRAARAGLARSQARRSCSSRPLRSIGRRADGLQWQGIRLLHADRSGTLWRANAEAGPRKHAGIATNRTRIRRDNARVCNCGGNSRWRERRAMALRIEDYALIGDCKTAALV